MGRWVDVLGGWVDVLGRGEFKGGWGKEEEVMAKKGGGGGLGVKVKVKCR